MSKKTKGSPKVSFRCHSVLRELMILASEKAEVDLGEWIRRACIASLGATAREIDPAMGRGLGNATQETKTRVSILGGKAHKSISRKKLEAAKESGEK